MPPETDPDILRLLLRVLRDRASNVVEFTEPALLGGHQRKVARDGLNALLPGEWTPDRKRSELRQALAEALERGDRPNRTEGQDMKGDPCTYHEFRVSIGGVALYVKTRIDDDDPEDPILQVLSVHEKYK